MESVAASGLAQIVAIADANADQRESARVIAPGAVLADSFDALLANELDGVVIATPSALHAAQASAALERGCAVFCQKPLARTAEEVRHIIATARAVDRLLGIDLSYRHTRALRAVRDVVATGQLGEVFAASLVFHNAYGPDKAWFYDPRLSGGGCVIDLGVHLVDAALWILGGEAVRVSSRLLHAGRPIASLEREVEDFATARIELSSQIEVDLACSWRLHAGQPAIIEANFHGTKGGAAFRNVGGSFTEFRSEHFTGTNASVLAEPPDDWGGGAILAWTRQLRAGARFDPAMEQHAAVADVLDAIYGRAAAPSLSFA